MYVAGYQKGVISEVLGYSEVTPNRWFAYDVTKNIITVFPPLNAMAFI